ncbi:stress-responsive transcriptional regulator PspC [Eubacteriaceae bacterium ES3]|nr:stress-responsive transcriptional regulator PspC [Eubacteriaceae bacterium ES3]
MLKRILMGSSVVAAAMLMVFGGFYFVEKRQEKEVGGKLVRVNYRFSREFDN